MHKLLKHNVRMSHTDCRYNLNKTHGSALSESSYYYFFFLLHENSEIKSNCLLFAHELHYWLFNNKNFSYKTVVYRTKKNTKYILVVILLRILMEKLSTGEILFF